MKIFEFFCGFFFVAMLHRLATVDTLDFWLVAVPAMLCIGLAQWGGYQQGRLSHRSAVPRYRHEEKIQ